MLHHRDPLTADSIPSATAGADNPSVATSGSTSAVTSYVTTFVFGMGLPTEYVPLTTVITETVTFTNGPSGLASSLRLPVKLGAVLCPAITGSLIRP
jgi:hypothetical protein